MAKRINVTLSEADVAFLDEYAQKVGSRSAAVREAIRLLRAFHLSDSYEAAWKEWFESGEEVVWSATVADGIDDE